MKASEIQAAVKKKYGEVAQSVRAGKSCCGPACCSSGEPMTGGAYGVDEAGVLPKEAIEASLGCGNPTALADLHEGDVVLDLGSGGGIDVLLSARRVGSSGKVYGLDMTEEMLALARENQRKAGVINVEFLMGDIQAVPLPDRSVDVVISNCVINLAPDKSAVLAEAFRVLRPGGRLAVSDVIVRGQVPRAIGRSLELWVGCVAGALDQDDYARKLAAAGFEDIAIETVRVPDPWENDAQGQVASAFIRARRPASLPASER